MLLPVTCGDIPIFALNRLPNRLLRPVSAAQYTRQHAFRLLEQRQQQMLAVYFDVLAAPRHPLGFFQRPAATSA